MGQQRRFGHVPTMSGLPLTADIVASIGDGREGKNAVVARRITKTKEKPLCKRLSCVSSNVSLF
jgi:hypothetical protein